MIYKIVMKYILLIISALLIIYPIYGLIKCLQSVSHLSSYGMGVIAGGSLILTIGITIMYFTIKLYRK